MSVCLVRQPQRRQRDTREAEAEFLERPAPRDRLGQALGQFIEFVVHNFPFVLVLWFGVSGSATDVVTVIEAASLLVGWQVFTPIRVGAMVACFAAAAAPATSVAGGSF